MDEEAVIVEYYDPATITGWCDREEAEREKPYLCKAIGMIVSEDKSFLRLASMYCNDLDNFNNRTIIPQGCIVKRRKMKEENGRSPN